LKETEILGLPNFPAWVGYTYLGFMSRKQSPKGRWEGGGDNDIFKKKSSQYNHLSMIALPPPNNVLSKKRMGQKRE